MTNIPGEDHDAAYDFSLDGDPTLLITSERPPNSLPSGNTWRIRSAGTLTGSPVTFGDGVAPTDGNLTNDFSRGGGDPHTRPGTSTIAFFKASLPIITSPHNVFTMNPQGGQKLKIPGEGLVNVHPNVGQAIDADGNGVHDYLEGPQVGTAKLTPRRLRAGELVRLCFAWRHPQRWRKLDSLKLRLSRGEDVAAQLRFVLKGRFLKLVNPSTGVYGSPGKLGRKGRLKAGGVTLDLRRTGFVNVSRKQLALDLALRLNRRLAGRRSTTYRVAVDADDSRGGDHTLERLGRVRVVR